MLAVLVAIGTTFAESGRATLFVLITERAQACRAEQKISAPSSRTKCQPSGGQDPNKVSAGKQQYVSSDTADTLDHAVRPRADLFWRFASRSAVAEQLPVWTFSKDFS